LHLKKNHWIFAFCLQPSKSNRERNDIIEPFNEQEALGAAQLCPMCRMIREFGIMIITVLIVSDAIGDLELTGPRPLIIIICMLFTSE